MGRSAFLRNSTPKAAPRAPAELPTLNAADTDATGYISFRTRPVPKMVAHKPVSHRASEVIHARVDVENRHHAAELRYASARDDLAAEVVFFFALTRAPAP